MGLDNIPLFSMLKGRLGYLSQRQNIVAQNVANASTPGFTPKDLQPFTVKPQGAGTVMTTNPMHLSGSGGRNGSHGMASAWKAHDAPDSETTLDGNQVVLEEQMMKMTEARMNYDAAIGFYQKSMNQLRMAARPPGR